jgi:superfamily II DNA/RNA helicase
MSFTRFDFHAKITAGIKACNYEIPTPIQEKTIPSILEGRDILGLAQTGTGKTAAFVLPILQRMLKGPRNTVRTLIVAPTRELAEQIHGEITRLGRQTGLNSMAVYGGVGKPAQARRLRSGVDIVVACPGRLLDHLRDKTFNLSKVEHLVLDEADHMFDMGFLPDIRRILNYLPAKRQTMLFSATMPDEIRHLAEEVLADPVRVQIGHSRPTATVSQVLYSVNPNNKVDLLKDIMSRTDMRSTLIFTKTKHRAKSLASQLQKAGYTATSLQGNLSQQKRQKALNGFKRGEFKVLVATDIAARGIDVSNISHVINFDMPATVDAYTHRIGRTGRAACTGEALTFASREDRKLISQIEGTLGGKLAWINGAAAGEDVPDSGPSASKPARKPFSRNRKGSPPSGHRKGRRNDGNRAFSDERKQKQSSALHNRAGSRQNKNRRAAIMIDGVGNLFLNP